MSAYEFDGIRLFVDALLAEGKLVALDKAQANYLTNVMRLGAGDRLLVFNGRDGEFAALLAGDRKRPALQIGVTTRAQTTLSRLRFLFAPLKHARLDYMVQKAVELGVGTIEPVITRRTQVSRLNLERMTANVIEAAEQCGVLSLPVVLAPVPFDRMLGSLGEGAGLVFCDEDAPPGNPTEALAALRGQEAAVLIGPEGGFDATERAQLMALPGCIRISLGPRILRADTAAVSALTLVQASWGDWR